MFGLGAGVGGLGLGVDLLEQASANEEEEEKTNFSKVTPFYGDKKAFQKKSIHSFQVKGILNENQKPYK